MTKIHSNQRSNCLSTEEKQGLKNEKIQKHSLIIHKQLIMFVKIQKTIIQQRKKVLTKFDDMTAYMQANKN